MMAWEKRYLALTAAGGALSVALRLVGLGL